MNVTIQSLNSDSQSFLSLLSEILLDFNRAIADSPSPPQTGDFSLNVPDMCSSNLQRKNRRTNFSQKKILHRFHLQHFALAGTLFDAK